MKIKLVLLASLFSISAYSQDPLEQMAVEEYYNHDQAILDGLKDYPTDHTTYRVYAELGGPEYRLQTVDGILNDYLYVGSNSQEITNSSLKRALIFIESKSKF